MVTALIFVLVAFILLTFIAVWSPSTGRYRSAFRGAPRQSSGSRSTDSSCDPVYWHFSDIDIGCSSDSGGCDGGGGGGD